MEYKDIKRRKFTPEQLEILEKAHYLAERYRRLYYSNPLADEANEIECTLDLLVPKIAQLLFI